MSKSEFFAKREGSHAGFIKAVIVIVIALTLLAYFGFDVKEWFDSPAVKNALEKTGDVIGWAWDTIIRTPALWIWNEIVIGILWEKVVMVVWEKVRN